LARKRSVASRKNAGRGGSRPADAEETQRQFEQYLKALEPEWNQALEQLEAESRSALPPQDTAR
jgi:hypothetical protein